MQIDEMVRLYKRGYSTTEISGRCDLSPKQVYTRLLKAGVAMRGRGFRRRTAVVDAAGYVRWGRRRIHRTVCEAWHGPPPSAEHEVNHIDGDKTNNHPENLEWVTGPENRAHALETGLVLSQDQHALASLTNEQVLRIASRLRSGEDTSSIAESLGIPRQTVSSIRMGHRWDTLTQLRGELPGRAVGSEVHNSRLNPVAVRVIRYFLAKGRTQKAVARVHRLPRSTIASVAQRRSWAHVE